MPEDPENKANKQPPYRLSVRTPSGGPNPVFSLTSVFVPQKRQNLASFISVDSDAAQSDYGTIRILRLPSNTQVPGPSQIANSFGSDQQIQQQVLPFTRSNAKVIYGNLLTLPVGDGLLYVQPLYTQRNTGQGTYPQLRFVLASFGDAVGVGTTLNDALKDVLGTTVKDNVSNGTGGSTSGGGGGAVSSDVRALLRQAESKFAAAQKSLEAGDLQGYAKAQGEARALVQQAITAADQASATPSPSPVASPSKSPSKSPSSSASPKS